MESQTPCAVPEENPSDGGEDWALQLSRLFRDAKRIVIVGMGNRFRSDDYVGSAIVKELGAKIRGSHSVKIRDAESMPENLDWTALQENAGLLVIADAVDMGLRPGSVRLVQLEETTYPFFTTHNLPLKLILRPSPKSKVVLLGIQPANVGFGETISNEVERARAKVVEKIARLTTQAEQEELKLR